MPYVDADNNALAAAARVQVGGFTGATTDCMDHAVDGYTVWGAPLVYKIAADYTATQINKSTATGTNITEAELDDERPFSTNTGFRGDLGGAVEGMNVGQIRAWVPILTDNAEWNCVIFTASEYYW